MYRLSQDLEHEAKWAVRQWQSWKSINDLKTRNDVQNLIFGPFVGGMNTVSMSLANATILSVIRLSDSIRSNPNRVSLCRCAKYLSDRKIVDVLASDDWLLTHRWNAIDIPLRRTEILEMIDRFLSAVPDDWSNKSPLKNPELTDLRKELRPWRDTRIAHLVEGNELKPLEIASISRLVGLTLELAQDFADIVVGFRRNRLDEQRHYRAQADEFWTLALSGPVARARPSEALADWPPLQVAGTRDDPG